MCFRIAVAIVFVGACLQASTPAGADGSAAPIGGGDRAPVASAGVLDSLLASTALDLGQLERAVIARNPSLEAAKAAWSEMAARADAAGTLDAPMLDLMAAPGSFGKSTVDEAYSVGLSQRVPIFGQSGLRGRAARSVARAAEEDYRTTAQALIHETRRLYFEYYTAARGAEVNRELSDLLGQFRRVALQRYAAGTAGQQDALQAEVEIAMLDHQRVVLERTRRMVLAQVRALLHDDGDRAVPEPPRELMEPGAPVDPDSAVAIAMRFRPELRGRAALRDARYEELRLAKRARWPEVTLQARYDRFMDVSEWRTSVGLGFDLPIGWGRIGANVRAAQAGLERAELERIAERDRVLAEISAARARVEETMHEVHVIEASVVPATERALASVRAGYEANRSDFLSLLNAERDLARARLGRYRARAEQGMALADLERAIGAVPAALAGEEQR
jgi:cobalt-zinc-cadmium efflux system outer membrane protein